MFLPEGESRFTVSVYRKQWGKEGLISGYDFGSDLEKAKEGYEKVCWLNENSSGFESNNIIRLLRFWTDRIETRVYARKEVLSGPDLPPKEDMEDFSSQFN